MSDISKGTNKNTKKGIPPDETVDNLNSPNCCSASYQNKVLEEDGISDNDTLGLDMLFNNSNNDVKIGVLDTVIDIDTIDDCPVQIQADDNTQNVNNQVSITIRERENVYIDFDAAAKELEEILISIMNMETATEQTENHDEHLPASRSLGNSHPDDLSDVDSLGGDDDSDPEEYSDEIRKVAVSAEEKYVLWLSKDATIGDFHDCTICFATSEMYDIVYCEQCDEHICFPCLKMHITTSISESKIVIECPGSTDCTKKLSEQLVSAFVPTRLMAIFVKNKVEAEQNPNIKTCPGCHRVETRTIEKEKSIPIHCRACNMTWCFLCHAPWHSGITCSDYQRDIEGAGTKALKYWAKSKINGSNNAKKCPKCNHYIERITGCDHMTCSRCKTDFCYRCGGKHYSFGWLGDHHSTYSFLGCRYNLYPNQSILRIAIRAFVTVFVIAISPLMALLALIFGVFILPCIVLHHKCKHR